MSNQTKTQVTATLVYVRLDKPFQEALASEGLQGLLKGSYVIRLVLDERESRKKPEVLTTWEFFQVEELPQEWLIRQYAAEPIPSHLRGGTGLRMYFESESDGLALLNLALPKGDTVSEPVSEPVSELEASPVLEPVSEPVPELEKLPVSEPVSEVRKAKKFLNF